MLDTFDPCLHSRVRIIRQTDSNPGSDTSTRLRTDGIRSARSDALHGGWRSVHSRSTKSPLFRQSRWAHNPRKGWRQHSSGLWMIHDNTRFCILILQDRNWPTRRRCEEQARPCMSARTTQTSAFARDTEANLQSLVHLSHARSVHDCAHNKTLYLTETRETEHGRHMRPCCRRHRFRWGRVLGLGR